jgi:nucleoid DNA-binding protein
MIHTYLKELIENNNRIIIPDLGAFMIQDSPEGKQISFNDFLKFNDGLLVNHIIKSEKISKNQASDMIKDFIKEVEKCFSKNTPFDIEGVGILTKDSHGNIRFETNIPSSPKKKVAATDVKPTIVLDEKPIAIEDKPIVILEKAEVPKAPEKMEEKPIEIKLTEKPALQVEKTEQPPKPVTPPVSAPKPNPAQTVKKPAPVPYKKKSNALKVVLISLLVIILVGGGIGAFLYFDLGKQITEFIHSKKEIKQDMVVTDTVAISVNMQDTASTMEVAKIEEPTIIEEPATQPVSGSKKYYIVGGSFKKPLYAERFNKKLINEGYNSEIITRENGFHLVTYKSVATRDEAQMEWNKMRQMNPQTWIFVK